jgi:hypothetical protein
MKRLVRWLFRLLILGIVLLVALLLLKDSLLKALAEWRIREQTGMSVTIKRLEVGILSPTFTLEGFKLYNPPEFGGLVCLDIPEVHFEYDPQAAAVGKLRLKLLRFHLHEVNLVRNQAGQTNLFSLVKKGDRAQTGGARQGSRPRIDFGGIDRLYLTLGAIKYTDLQQPTNNWQRTIGWKDYEVRDLRTGEDVQNFATKVLMQIALQEYLLRSRKDAGPSFKDLLQLGKPR